MICSSCGTPVHPETCEWLSEKTVICGPCRRSFWNWIKGMMSRRWGKLKFYEYAETSRNKTKEQP